MIVTCGDAVIDLMPEPVPGGSNVNVAVAAGRLGAPTAYLGRISVDRYGDMLMKHLEESGVDTRLVERGAEPTAKAIVTLDPTPSFRFEADDTAEANLSRADLSPLGPGPHIVHGGTFGMYLGRTATVLAELIERSPGLISLDPNVRPTIIDDRASWDRWHERWLRHVSLYRCSDEDLAWIWPGRSIDSVAAELIEKGVTAVIVTRGAEGCEIFTPSWAETRRGSVVEVVDTVGAGDTFTGGILFGLHEGNIRTRASLASMDKATFLEIADIALLAAAMVCGRQGADPPWRHELDAFDSTEAPDTNGPPRST
jgi:fructokinase